MVPLSLEPIYIRICTIQSLMLVHMHGNVWIYTHTCVHMCMCTVWLVMAHVWVYMNALSVLCSGPLDSSDGGE